MILFIGSYALFRLGHRSQFNDVDIVGTYDEVLKFAKELRATSFFPILGGKKYVFKTPYGVIYEAEIAWENSSGEDLLNVAKNHLEKTFKEGSFEYGIPSLNFLYTLKRSHRFLKNTPHFEKTWNDIFELEKLGAETPFSLKEFLERREKATYTYDHPKLNVSKKDFFSDEMNYVYDHDSIHAAITPLRKPAYQYFIDGQVWCSKKLWDKQDDKIKLAAVIEESVVLSIERSLVPFPGVLTREQAYKKALQKVCTSITSGWFREYAWKNYYKALEAFDDAYYVRFSEALMQGKIKPFLS